MAQVVVRVIFEANCGGGRPLRMLLSSTFLRQAGQLDLLSLPQLADQGALPFGVSNDRVSDCIVRSLALDDQVARVDRHYPAATARMQRERHAAARTVVLAVAVARVNQVLVAVFRVQGDHAQAVGEHLIWQNRSIAFDFDQVQRDGGHFGQDGTAERVGQGQVDRAQAKINTVWLRLLRIVSFGPWRPRHALDSLRGR